MPAQSEFQSSFRITTIELEHDVVVRFRAEAARRDKTVPQLIRELLEVIAAEPTLVTAVLDDQPEGRK